jgi:hypothetical protein
MPCMTLDQKIQVWIAVGAWLSAIATFSAVVVSLRLATRQDRAVLRLYLAFGNHGPDSVELSVTNLSTFELSVVDAGFYRGKGQRYSLRTAKSGIASSSFRVRIPPWDEVEI